MHHQQFAATHSNRTQSPRNTAIQPKLLQQQSSPQSPIRQHFRAIPNQNSPRNREKGPGPDALSCDLSPAHQPSTTISISCPRHPLRRELAQGEPSSSHATAAPGSGHRRGRRRDRAADAHATARLEKMRTSSHAPGRAYGRRTMIATRSDRSSAVASGVASGMRWLRNASK
jgi:hypothetical protein